MSEIQGAPGAEEPKLEGRRFLWNRPEVLSREQHEGLGLVPVEHPFAFTATARAIPLTWTEFRSAQAHYPIVFTEGETTVPVAALALKDEHNLLVDAEGRWEEMAYVPAYVRTHPFALARTDGDRVALVIDRDAACISDATEQPFFEGDQLHETMNQRVEFCRVYENEVQRTQTFCRRLLELDLLAMQTMRRDGAEEDLVRFRAVDAEKLAALPVETLDQLFREGWLAAIYAHIFSLDRWGELLRRADTRAAQ